MFIARPWTKKTAVCYLQRILEKICFFFFLSFLCVFFFFDVPLHWTGFENPVNDASSPPPYPLWPEFVLVSWLPHIHTLHRPSCDWLRLIGSLSHWEKDMHSRHPASLSYQYIRGQSHARNKSTPQREIDRLDNPIQSQWKKKEYHHVVRLLFTLLCNIDDNESFVACAM